MKNIKTKKGITLIALIITIVVLLILAAVTVSSIVNDGVIVKAEDAASNYKQEQLNENATLDSYLNYFNTDGSLSENSTSGGTTVVCSVHGSAHIFDQEVISQEYEHNSVTNCRVKASCYLSCECGESSNDWHQIFYYGNYGSHDYESGYCIHCGEYTNRYDWVS